MKIVEDKLPLKYALGLHTRYDGYPTDTDYLFELCRYLTEKGTTDRYFKASSVKAAFNNNMDVDEVTAILDRLVSLGRLEKKENQKQINEYKLLRHDWA